MKKKNNYYFEAFEQLIGFSCEASNLLKEVVNDFANQSLLESKVKMHLIEHNADLEKHKVIKRLLKEFITPIDREDIIELTQVIDDVTDSIEEIVLRLYIFDVKVLRKEVLSMADIVFKSCQSLKMMFGEMTKSLKNNKILEYIIEVNNYEEMEDKLYLDALRDLYVSKIDVKDIMIWEDLYNRFENCCDVCEEVSEIVEKIMMKNN